MVVHSPCKALIERAKLTIDLILTYILARTLSASLSLFGGAQRTTVSGDRQRAGHSCSCHPTRLTSVYVDIQCRPLLGLKNRSLIFLRWDDLITHECQRKAGNWMTGSQEHKACISPLPLHHLQRALWMYFSFKNHLTEAGKWGRPVGVECEILLGTLALGVLWLLFRRLKVPTYCLQGLSLLNYHQMPVHQHSLGNRNLTLKY